MPYEKQVPRRFPVERAVGRLTRVASALDERSHRIVERVRADPGSPLRLVVAGPGGYGKSTLLREIARTYREAGVAVVTDPWAEPATDRRQAVILLDDAHQLDGTQLKSVLDLACTRLVVAWRPWPRSEGLITMFTALSRENPPLMLEPLDAAGVRRLLAGMGVTVSAEDAEFVHSLTGGVPGWTARVGAAWPAGGDHTGLLAHAAAGSFSYDLDVLDLDVVRYLVAAQSGVGMHVDLVGRLLGLDGAAVADVMRAARATGLIGPNGALTPWCAQVVVTAVPAETQLAVRQRLAELQLERAQPVLPFARSLLGTGATGESVAEVLFTAAREAVTEEPALAAELFSASVEAGRPFGCVAVEWARASALAGDLDTALRLADLVMMGDDEPLRIDGARIAAAALAHRGQLERSAMLFQWAGGGSFAEIATIGAGELVEATGRTGGGPPTLVSGAAALMAEGIRQSVSGSAREALSSLVRASALMEPVGHDVLLPDTPAALAAIVALHCGELDIAESALDGAIAVRMGSGPLVNRHRLLRGWIAMLRGRLVEASQLLAEATTSCRPLEARDRLFATGLEVGLARRAGDMSALRRVWTHATESLMRHPVDLFMFLPLGEFMVAAARLDDSAQLEGPLRDAYALAHRLGDPALWVTPLHWSGLHAAIAAGQPAAAMEHTRQLHTNRASYGAALARAASCWIDVVSDRVEPARVQAAARALHDCGLWWDAARLTGEAAIRTTDHKEMVTLLDCARQLQARQQQLRAPAPAGLPGGDVPAAREATTSLSLREQEVAALVLRGLTYKQIGGRLFISAKTVEHHMARMRHRLGATDRSELLTQLRALTESG
jgi:DNA-binding CsgD family transcriptional regulator